MLIVILLIVFVFSQTYFIKNLHLSINKSVIFSVINCLIIFLLNLKFSNLDFLQISIFFSIAFIIIHEDLITLKIPNYFSLSLIILGILFSLFPNSYISLSESFLGAVIGFLFYYSVSFSYKILKKQIGLGGGDIKLITAVGANFGIYSIFFTTILAAIITLIIFPKIQKKSKFPFAPGIILAVFLFVLFKFKLINLLNY